jgi:6,7-dimethyl-8-ribityllumazine synthase
MGAQIAGTIQGQGRKLALVASRFNEGITRNLVDGARDELVRCGVAEDAIRTYWVPGAFELPAVAGRVAASGGFDAVVCLGAVIRGGTPHFDFVAAEAAKGVAAVAMQSACPVVFGVLTCDSEEQARERAGGKGGNRGADAARAALELADLYGRIG